MRLLKKYFFLFFLISITIHSNCAKSVFINSQTGKPEQLDISGLTYDRWLSEWRELFSSLNSSPRLKNLSSLLLEIKRTKGGTNIDSAKFHQTIDLLNMQPHNVDSLEAKILSYMAFYLGYKQDIQEPHSDSIKNFLSQDYITPCIKKKIVQRRVNMTLLNKGFDERLFIEDLNFIKENKDRHFRNFMMKQMVKKIGYNLQARDHLVSFLKKNPNMIYKNINILNKSEKESFIKENKFTHLIYNRSCHKARNYLLDELKIQPQKYTEDELLRKVRSLVRCGRASSLKKKLRLWTGIISDFGPYVNERIRLLLSFEKVKIYRKYDLDNKSKKHLTELSKQALHGLHMDIYSLINETLAKVYINTADLDNAIQITEHLVSIGYGLENNHETLQILIKAYLGKKKWAKVIEITNKMILRDNKLYRSKSDNRDFLFFWQGMAYHYMGNHNKAASSLERVAHQYYSTYYGAMSHYILENNLGIPQPLYPFNNSSISPYWYHSSFDGNQKLQLELALFLLSVGLETEAKCEIKNLKVDHLKENQILTDSLFKYLTGDWLGTIIGYSSLSRPFRESIPFGVEKVLFPRKYTDQVEKYSARLNVDSDLILALIRQESVFNKRARSSAGARGLMQLMGSTATRIAKKLPSHYISKTEKRKIMRKIRRSKNLYDVDYNLIIGIYYMDRLIKRYGNVVPALASYNAGPRNVKKWLKLINTDDPLYFIERVPFKETRKYVKLILRNYFYYKKLYPKDINNVTSKLSLFDQSVFANF